MVAKRRIVVDPIGLLLVVMVSAASVQDATVVRSSSSVCTKHLGRSVIFSLAVAARALVDLTKRS
jgi:hypothetical protein